MELTKEQLKDIAAELTGDGDTYELDDRFSLKLLIDHDPDTSINDSDCYGKVSEYRKYRREAYPTRPAGFTGRAMKIEADRNGFVWWEPYGDTIGWVDSDGVQQYGKWEQLPAEQRDDDRQQITDLIQIGFLVIRVSLRELVADVTGSNHTVQVNAEWLGGCDSVCAEIVTDLACDAVSEIDATLIA